MEQFESIIEKIREANRIEDVVEELGYTFERKAGKYWRVPHTGGLVVNVADQRFFWAQRGWNGDVFELVEKEKGWDFKTAAEWLAQRANLPAPRWGRQSEEARKAHRLKLSVFEIAHRLFVKWLWEDDEALAYARSRGFDDDALREMEIGFSGRRTEAQIKEMRGEFSMYEIDPECPQAVSVLAFRGDVVSWGKKWGIDPDPDWIRRGKISGMMNVPGLVYRHKWGGRIIYLSRRQLPGHDEIDGRTWKSYNPPRKLVGMRQPYFNYIYRPDAEACVIVEGPMDAETFGVWGWSAVALCGVHAEDQGIAQLKQRLQHHKTLYLALDDDEAGREKREKVAAAFGPMTRLVQLPSRGSAEAVMKKKQRGKQ